jgi:hypothetical protein
MSGETPVLEPSTANNRRVALLWFVLGAATASGLILCYFGWRAVNMVLQDPYAVEHTAGLIIRYMEQHQNRWPQSWQDLEKTQQITDPGNRNFSVQQLKQIVAVDWNADPKNLAKAELSADDQPPFRVIWLRNGNSAHWSSTEPNQMILEYLQRSLMRSK